MLHHCLTAMRNLTCPDWAAIAHHMQTVELIADFIANVVVDKEFKGSLRTTMHARKDPIDFLDYKFPAEAVDKIKKMYTDEKQKWEKATADRKSIVDAQAEQRKLHSCKMLQIIVSKCLSKAMAILEPP